MKRVDDFQTLINEHQIKIDAELTPDQRVTWETFKLERQIDPRMTLMGLSDDQKTKVKSLVDETAKSIAALTDGKEVEIAQSVHQVAVTRSWVVLFDTAFRVGFEQWFNDPFPGSEALRALLARPQLPYTNVYLVPRAALTGVAEAPTAPPGTKSGSGVGDHVSPEGPRMTTSSRRNSAVALVDST